MAAIDAIYELGNAIERVAVDIIDDSSRTTTMYHPDRDAARAFVEGTDPRYVSIRRTILEDVFLEMTDGERGAVAVNHLLDVPDEIYIVVWGDLVYVKKNLVEVLLTGLMGPLLHLLAFGFNLTGSMFQENNNYLAFIISSIISFTTPSATSAPFP